jgi:hypothetical protein
LTQFNNISEEDKKEINHYKTAFKYTCKNESLKRKLKTFQDNDRIIFEYINKQNKEQFNENDFKRYIYANSCNLSIYDIEAVLNNFVKRGLLEKLKNNDYKRLWGITENGGKKQIIQKASVRQRIKSLSRHDKTIFNLLDIIENDIFYLKDINNIIHDHPRKYKGIIDSKTTVWVVVDHFVKIGLLYYLGKGKYQKLW